MLLMCLALIGSQAAAFTPNPKAGAQISQTCAACHGDNGFSVDNTIPNLAGQHYAYLVTQLNAFKSRSRNAPLMNELARSLTEEQIEDIAAYYAGVSIELAKKPKH